MKALTLWQPWASAIAAGVKTVETRSWSTRYRGEVLIHAAKIVQPALEAETILGWPRQAALEIYGDPDSMREPLGVAFPRGEVVAVARLVDVLPAEEAARKFPRQVRFGHFGPGRFGWVLEGVQRCARGVEVSGRQGLWNPTPDEEAAVEAALVR